MSAFTARTLSHVSYLKYIQKGEEGLSSVRMNAYEFHRPH